MPKPKHPKFTGTATSKHQVANDVSTVLFTPEGAIVQYVEQPRRLSGAELRWAKKRQPATGSITTPVGVAA